MAKRSKKRGTLVNISGEHFNLRKAKIPKSHIAIFREHAKNTERHFVNDGWDLSWSHLMCEVVSEILGYDVSAYHLASLAERKKMPGLIITQTGKRGDMVLRKAGRRVSKRK